MQGGQRGTRRRSSLNYLFISPFSRPFSSLFVSNLQDVIETVRYTPSKMFSEQITKYHSVKWMDHKEQHFFKGKQASWYSNIWSFIGRHSLPQNILGKWTILFLNCFQSEALYAVLIITILIECFHSFVKFHFKDIHISEVPWSLQMHSHFSVLWTTIALQFLFLNHAPIPAYIFNM